MGDDLHDNFQLEFEDPASASGSVRFDDSDVGVGQGKPKRPVDQSAKETTKKKKARQTAHQAADTEEDQSPDSIQPADDQPEKTEKSKKKLPLKRKAPRDIPDIERAGTVEQADFFWTKLLETQPEADSGLQPSGEHFVDTSAFGETRVVAHFEALLRLLEPDWKAAYCTRPAGKGTPAGGKAGGKPGGKKAGGKDQHQAAAAAEPGAPLVIVVSSATQRCIDLIEALSAWNAAVPIAKTYSKMIKIPKQTTFLERSYVRIAIGTPARVAKLIEMGALKTSQLKYLIVDAAYRNEKTFNIFQVRETLSDLSALYVDHLGPLIMSGQVRLCFF